MLGQGQAALVVNEIDDGDVKLGIFQLGAQRKISQQLKMSLMTVLRSCSFIQFEKRIPHGKKLGQLSKDFPLLVPPEIS